MSDDDAIQYGLFGLTKRVYQWELAGRPKKRFFERYKDYEYQLPSRHDHQDWFWTRAEGIWYCKACEDWYRTWRVFDL